MDSVWPIMCRECLQTQCSVAITFREVGTVLCVQAARTLNKRLSAALSHTATTRSLEWGRNERRRSVIWPAGWCTSRATSSSARTSTSSTWYPGSPCSPSSCTAIPGGPADPAPWPRRVSCSSCHCLRTHGRTNGRGKKKKQTNNKTRQSLFGPRRARTAIRGSRRTLYSLSSEKSHSDCYN